MPSSIRNRGKNSGDDLLFGEKQHRVLTHAVDDLCYLLSREYGSTSAVELVGNRYKLNKRQREAILRIASSNKEILHRKLSECDSLNLQNSIVEIDGFNLLIILESALSGAYVFKCRDGCYRDISSVHGSYKRVIKTREAITMVGDALNQLGVKKVIWYFDAPVSNSGRLKTLLLAMSQTNDYCWEIELLNSPDRKLAKSKNIVITSDGWILDRAEKWFNLAMYLIDHQIRPDTVVAV